MLMDVFLQVAARSGSKLYFTMPESLVAGAPARLYFNRARSWALRHNPNVRVSLRAGCSVGAAARYVWRRAAHFFPMSPAGPWM